MTVTVDIPSLPDFSALSAIHRACFERGWSEQAFAEMFAITGTQDFVAQGSFGILRHIGDEAEIITIAVLPEQRRQGTGTAILAAMLEYARTQNVKSLFLEVRESNKAALALYSSAGFRLLSTRKNYYANSDHSSEDAVVMKMEL